MLGKYADTQNILERILFFLLSLFFLLPVWGPAHFHTIDGGGHVYNAFAIKDILISRIGDYASFYEVNFFPSPNWISQPVIILLSFFVKAETAEKLTWSLIVFCFLYGWRFYLKRIGAHAHRALSYLGFLFVYHQTLFLGFINYEASLAILPFALGNYHQWRRSGSGRIQVVLILLAVLLYFSHLVGIFVFTCYVVIYELFDIRPEERRLSTLLSAIGRLFPVLITPGVLLLFYLLHDKESTGLSWLPAAAWWNRIKVLDPLICLRMTEWSYLRWYLIIPSSAFIIEFCLRFFLRREMERNRISPFHFIFPLFLLLFSLLLPDASSGGGGYLVVRLSFVAILFVFLFALQTLRKQAMLLATIVALNLVGIDRLFYLYRSGYDIANDLDSLNEIENHLERNAIIAQLEWDQLPVMAHYPELMAANKHVICLNSLGAHKNFSSLNWKPRWRKNEKITCWSGNAWQCDPNDLFEISAGRPCYLLIHGSCTEGNCNEWRAFLEQQCKFVWSNELSYQLYRLK